MYQDGKTHVMTEIDIQMPNRTVRDTLKVKVNMGTEANILPV